MRFSLAKGLGAWLAIGALAVQAGRGDHLPPRRHCQHLGGQSLRLAALALTVVPGTGNAACCAATCGGSMVFAAGRKTCWLIWSPPPQQLEGE